MSRPGSRLLADAIRRAMSSAGRASTSGGPSGGPWTGASSPITRSSVEMGAPRSLRSPQGTTTFSQQSQHSQQTLSTLMMRSLRTLGLRVNHPMGGQATKDRISSASKKGIHTSTPTKKSRDKKAMPVYPPNIPPTKINPRPRGVEPPITPWDAGRANHPETWGKAGGGMPAFTPTSQLKKRKNYHKRCAFIMQTLEHEKMTEIAATSSGSRLRFWRTGGGRTISPAYASRGGTGGWGARSRCERCWPTRRWSARSRCTRRRSRSSRCWSGGRCGGGSCITCATSRFGSAGFREISVVHQTHGIANL